MAVTDGAMHEAAQANIRSDHRFRPQRARVRDAEAPDRAIPPDLRAGYEPAGAAAKLGPLRSLMAEAAIGGQAWIGLCEPTGAAWVVVRGTTRRPVTPANAAAIQMPREEVETTPIELSSCCPTSNE